MKAKCPSVAASTRAKPSSAVSTGSLAEITLRMWLYCSRTGLYIIYIYKYNIIYIILVPNAISCLIGSAVQGDFLYEAFHD